MNRRALAEQERRRAKQRLIALAVAAVLLAAVFAFVAFRVFSGRAVLLRGENVDVALSEAFTKLGSQRQPADVDCPDKDLRRGDRVVCSVRFTDGSTAKVRFGVKGTPNRITPIIEDA